MITSVSSLATYSQNLDFIPKYCKKLASTCVFLTEKVRQVAYPYIVASSGTYYCGQGASELVVAKKLDSNASDKAIEPKREYLITHGVLMGATGVCGILEGLNGFGAISYGKFAQSVCVAGSIFFLYANIANLEENIRVYHELMKNADLPKGLERDHFIFQKSSVIWGILSNLGYIFATACLLFNASATMAFIFGVLGSFSGAFKFLCDCVLEIR